MIGKITLIVFITAVASLLFFSSFMPGFSISNSGYLELGPTMAYGSVKYVGPSGNSTTYSLYSLSLNDIYLVSFTNQVQIVVTCPYASVVSISTNGHYIVQGDQVIIQDYQFPYVNIIYNSTHQPQPTILVQMSIGQGSLGVIGVDSA